ncbi:bis(5'-nucleosyl)-tetraphosphatase (symmetrical) YqeK [Mycoplasma nasistruthionis]|uniref:bis(5'-nucleosyl)-tetraphosphatase (symmetrical) YqeK n=1 Tax=Mycoplasma nasistruthionis TaxID=353852 RepID=UPI0030844C25
MLKNEPIEASSTIYKKGVFEIVSPEVQNYIQKHFLYAEQIIHNYLSAKRAKHCMATGEFAANLAKAHGFSARQAYYAGIFHDIAKEIDPEIQKQWILNNEPDMDVEYPKYKLHQYAGYIWLKYGYLLEDQEILNAIKIHTSMAENMTSLDKILFIADKICQGRKFPGIQKVRELTFKDLEAGFQEVVKYTYQFNIDKGVEFDQKQESLYRKWGKF